MKCEICKENVFKYKCPKCGIKYCSLVCYKDPNHNHDNIEQNIEPRKDESEEVANIEPEDTQLQKIIGDEKIIYLLRQPALQFHLSVIYDILNDVQLTKEFNKEGRYDIANKKLTNLRAKGVEENELVEEFCSRVVELLQ